MKVKKEQMCNFSTVTCSFPSKWLRSRFISAFCSSSSLFRRSASCCCRLTWWHDPKAHQPSCLVKLFLMSDGVICVLTMFLCSCRRLSISRSNCSLVLSKWSSACFVLDSTFTVSAFCTTTNTNLLWSSKRLLGEKAQSYILPSSSDRRDWSPALRVFLSTEWNVALQPGLYLHKMSNTWRWVLWGKFLLPYLLHPFLLFLVALVEDVEDHQTN